MSARTVLLEKLKHANVTPTPLAKALGVSVQMASMILTGRRGISTWHLDSVATLLGLEVHELFLPIGDARAHAHGARADLSHTKKSGVVTSPDSGAGVQDTHTRGGSHAAGSSVSSSRVLADRQAALLDGIVGAAAEFFDLAERLRKFGDMSGELTEHAGKLLELAGADDSVDGAARAGRHLPQRHGAARRPHVAGGRHPKRASR